MADEEGSGKVTSARRRDALEDWVLGLVLGSLRVLPERVAAEVASRVATQGMYLTRQLRQTGMDNLAIAFPEHDEAWRKAILLEVFRNLGRLAGELAHFDELTAANVRDKVGFASSADERRWQESVGGGARVIATGHFGNWELLVQAQALLGHPIALVNRPFKNSRAEQRLTEIRTRVGTTQLPKRAAARELLKRLRAGELIALPIDQREPGARGYPVPFFGKPAKTTLGPARLAQLCQVPIQVVVLARRGNSLEHEMIVQEPIDPPPKSDKDPELLIEMMRRVNASFEDCIRRYPGQWLWVHRRWRE